MGEIAARYDLMPESTDVPLDEVTKTIQGIIPNGVKLIETKIEPVAFGLKKIVIGLIIDDSIDGVGTTLEDALRSLEGIENVECTSSALL